MLADLARFCVRRRWIVVFAIWLPVVIVVNAIAGAAGSAFSTEFTPPDSESADVIEQLQGSDVPAEGVVGGELVEGAVAGELCVVECFGGVSGLDGG